MRLDYSASPFVILGGWNPNIVNENWIRKNLLDSPNEQVKIQLGGSIPATGIPVSIAQVIFSNLRLAVLGERLELNLINGNDFAHIEDCVRKLCDRLPNTLVTGYGVNFTYVADAISSSLISIFSADALSQMSHTQSHTYNLDLHEITTGISIDMDNDQNKSAIRFNFHFNMNDLSVVIQRLAEYPINSLGEKAIEFASNEYGLRLEN